MIALLHTPVVFLAKRSENFASLYTTVVFLKPPLYEKAPGRAASATTIEAPGSWGLVHGVSLQVDMAGYFLCSAWAKYIIRPTRAPPTMLPSVTGMRFAVKKVPKFKTAVLMPASAIMPA